MTPDSKVSDVNRADFEAAYLAAHGLEPDAYIFQRAHYDETKYWNEIVQRRWEGWQLARANQQPSAQWIAGREMLRRALSFYADQSRYRGSNQRLESPDEWTERAGLKAYRLDVTRDGGLIAMQALDGTLPQSPDTMRKG